MNKKIAGIAGALLLGAAVWITTGAAAQANTYTWKITGGFTGSGTFTTASTPYSGDISDFADPNTGSAYLVTAFTGTFAGKNVKLVPVVTPGTGPYFADNLFYPNGTYPFVDDDGLWFETLTSAGAVSQMYSMFDSLTCHVEGADTEVCADLALIGYPHIPGGSKTVTFSFVDTTPAAVPEPASWAMTVAGLGLAGAAMRRKKAVICDAV